MEPTLYPTLEEALFLHGRLLERFGGAPGVRDLGLLDSALARPRSGYYRSLSEQAAALLQSLALNHSFVDGNERMAFALAAVFLRINGTSLRVDAEAGERFLIDEVIVAKADLAVITDWLEAHMSK
ncbi:MAG: type II toxin-antitoxin system death-on-curing family toxin [Planctomycetes bacterium]|nr:type II toxin-antitoxin system death-on-curing family toxin [Planctomycetota bacterium]